MLPKLLAASALLALTACGETSTSWDRELGSEVDKGQFGNATMNNTLIQTGEMSYTVALAERFDDLASAGRGLSECLAMRYFSHVRQNAVQATFAA